MKLNEAVQRLQAGLIGELPGHGSFPKPVSYPGSTVQEARDLVPKPRESAVLACLFERSGSAYTLLIRRPQYEGVHSGQVAFPGGHHEPYDADLEATALREFREETGADSQHHVLGALSPIYIPPSNSIVNPFVGYTKDLGMLAPAPEEVAEVLEVPLNELLQPNAIRSGDRTVQVMGKQVSVAYYELQGHFVWGATAMIIAELRALLGATEEFSDNGIVP
jgi:8-oxo-dGTP pyrophosphatase MutT (NUDIX family)